MKQLARRASLVVVLLLTSVGTASAECAWVLWGVPYPPKDVMFLPVDAFKTREECMREKDSRSESIKAELKEDAVRGLWYPSASPTPSTRAGRRGSRSRR